MAKKIHMPKGFLISSSGDLPGGPEVGNLPVNAGDLGLIPGTETRMPHAMEQLRLQATTTEACMP